MKRNIYSVITGTGCYIPTEVVKNEDFLDSEFFDSAGNKFEQDNQYIIDKFIDITTIAERRHVTDAQVTSDIAFLAAEKAIASAGIDREELDYIIVAHNFGDVKAGTNRTDMVPSLAARVKYQLGINNPGTVAFDLIFGCPGWLQGVIMADYLIRSGQVKKALVIGADTLSRVSDPHDRDSMLYSDGAGATILEARETDEPTGIIDHAVRSDTKLHSKMLIMDKSYNLDHDQEYKYLKMNGRRLYQYAIDTVPGAIKECLDKSQTPIETVKKILIHQANGKMDDVIVEKLYQLCQAEMPADVMPMTISWLGNSSVATIPTLLDLILRNQLAPHTIHPGDTIVFASVGAGMNINTMVYKV